MNTLQFISKYWVWSGSVKFRTKQTHTYTDKFSLLILSVITAVTLILVAFYGSTNEYTLNLWVTNTLYCIYVCIQIKSSWVIFLFCSRQIIKITTGDQLLFSLYFAPACFFSISFLFSSQDNLLTCWDEIMLKWFQHGNQNGVGERVYMAEIMFSKRSIERLKKISFL